MKERFLTVLVPVKDSDVTQTYQTLPALLANVTPSIDNINNIYAVGAPVFGYMRTWLNPATNQYEFHQVVDREFPYLGKPLEIFDFTYDATRMGSAPTITAQGIMWYADKDSSGNDVTLEGLWSQECHVSFNGENFYLKQIPTSSKSNEDARYKYDIDFVSERVVLERVYLYDVVQPFVSSKPISESAQFSFYGDITELAKRINASLLRSGLATIALKSGVTPGSYLTYEEFNSVGLGTYTGTKDTSDPYPIVPGEMQSYIHYPHANIYEHFGGNYTKYLLNLVYLVDNPQSYHIGPATGGYDEIYDGEPRLSGYKCLIGKDKKGVMTTSEEKLITFENNTIHEALQQFHDTFGLQYYIYRDTDSNGDFTGDTIIMVADCQHDFADWDATAASGEGDYTRDSDGIPTTTHPFDYGVEDALLSKEKTNITDKIITRITGVGSEENIPWYYPNPNADGWLRPMYKRDGEIYPSVTINYPTSEGTTISESVLYEKYLKNRIGNNFYFGRLYNIIQANRSAGSADGFKQSSVLVSGNAAELKCIINITESETFVEFDVSAVSSITNTYIVKKDGVSYTPSFSFLNGKGFLPTGKYIITYGFLAEEGHNFIEDTFTIYYYYRGRSWAETGLSTNGNLTHHYVREGRDDYEEWWTDQNGNEVTLITPQIRTYYYIYHDNDPSNNQIDCLYLTASGRSNEHITEATLTGSAEFIQNVMKGDIRLYNGDSWYMSNKKKVNLADYGLSNIPSNSNCMVGDTIEFQRIKYVTPQPRLMPEVYIKTDGERRFYNAHNYYPLQQGTPDAMIGEKNQEGSTNIINPLYKEHENDPNNKHYQFENEYVQIMPHEHIEEFEDVKPTITGQQSYIRVYPTEDDFNADPESYYTKVSGVYTQCTSSTIYSGTTAYYQLVRIDIVEEFAFDELDNNEVWEENSEEGGAGEYKHPLFFAKIRPLGFNIFDLALQDDMILSMTTGHCGACNFRIAVDENTKKNPVQIWQYDVYKKNDDGTYSATPYLQGMLRRYVDTENLYYKIGNEYVDVHGRSQNTVGFLVPSWYSYNQYQVADFDEEDVANGLVGTMKNKSKIVFAGDVVTRGGFVDSQQDTSENFVWVALYKDTETYGVIMPSAQPDYGDDNYSHYIDPKGHIYTDRKTGLTEVLEDSEADKFVLTNIRLPQAYLRRAERDLSRRIIAYMYDNNYQKFNFSIKFSRIYLAENDTIEGNLNENSVLYVTFNNKIYRQYAKHYTYRMLHGAALPEISVELNEELSVSRTSIEQQTALQAQTTTNNQNRWRREIVEAERRILRNTIGRYDEALLVGDFISRGARMSVSGVRRLSDGNENLILDTDLDIEFNHFRRRDFEVFNGTDLRIGDQIFLPTAFKNGHHIVRRKWDNTTQQFIDDSTQNFSPAFVDANGKVSDYAINGSENHSITPAKQSDLNIIRHTVEQRFIDNGFANSSTTCGGTSQLPSRSIMTVTIDNVQYLFWTNANGENILYQGSGSGQCQDDPF